MNVFSSKLIVYVVAAFGCGAMGAVVALNLLRIQPAASFSINWTAYAIFIVVIGGFGSIEGPILGAIIYFALQQTLSQYGSTYFLLLGVIAVLMATKVPRGLWGLVTDPLGPASVPGQARSGARRRRTRIPGPVAEPGARRTEASEHIVRVAVADRRVAPGGPLCVGKTGASSSLRRGRSPAGGRSAARRRADRRRGRRRAALSELAAPTRLGEAAPQPAPSRQTPFQPLAP